MISLFFLLLIGINSSTWGREVVDATGVKTQLVELPLRVVTLAPSLGELCANFMREDLNRLVGVSEFSDYPPALRSLNSIGPYYQVNIEKIVSLKPDLILATLDGNSKEQVQQLRELGLPVVAVKTQSIQEIEESMRQVANALGNPTAGEKMATQLKAGIQHIRDRGKARSHLKILLQVGDHPLVVVGKQSFLHEAIEVIGGRNIYEDAILHYPRPSLEEVMVRDPDVIVVMAMMDDLAPFRKMVEGWNRYKNLKAVKNHRIYLLKNDALLRPTLRFLEGLSLLEKVVYGKS